MSTPKNPLAKALRDFAHDIAQIDDQPLVSEDRGYAVELVRVLARVVEGKPIEKAFGAPGDWGYSTPLGDGLLAWLEDEQAVECHGLDTPERVCFYEQDFYVLSNFSSFAIQWKGKRFDTSEAAYHFEKFPHDEDIQCQIWMATSAHESLKIATSHKQSRRVDWDDVKVDVMREIIRAKAEQHEYVRRKLLATGERELVENSWRDDFWGWGPNRDGTNMLGKLWMEVRAELRAKGGAS